MDIKSLIESSKSAEAIASSVYQEQNDFEKLSEELKESCLVNPAKYQDVMAKSVSKPLSDPAYFDDRVATVCYGRKLNEGYFVVLVTERGEEYEIGQPFSLKEAYEQAKVLLDAKVINLSELNAQRVK